MIYLKNGKYLTFDGQIKSSSLLLDGELIKSTDQTSLSEEGHEIIDISGMTVIPGFIDIHFHGAVGSDVMFASPEDILKISDYLAKNGTTSFLPTTITSTHDDLLQALLNIKKASKLSSPGASIEGVHIEGPYISPKQKGCHEPKLMRCAQDSEYDELKNIISELKLHFTVAPETQNAIDFISYVVSHDDTVSIGHSDADSIQTQDALQAGATVFTHLFNAMKGINHREPGVAGTALCSDAYVELICDGVHVNPEIMKLVYKIKGKEKIILVTDAMQAAGLGDGDYIFGGLKVIVRDGIARNENGNLASSTLTMLAAVKNMIKFTGASLADAVQMATLNPARLLGLDNYIGSIDEGKRADLLVLDNNLNIIMVFCKGTRII